MSENNAGQANRRSVLKTSAGLLATGLGGSLVGGADAVEQQENISTHHFAEATYLFEGIPEEIRSSGCGGFIAYSVDADGADLTVLSFEGEDSPTPPEDSGMANKSRNAEETFTNNSASVRTPNKFNTNTPFNYQKDGEYVVGAINKNRPTEYAPIKNELDLPPVNINTTGNHLVKIHSQDLQVDVQPGNTTEVSIGEVEASLPQATDERIEVDTSDRPEGDDSMMTRVWENQEFDLDVKLVVANYGVCDVHRSRPINESR